MIPAGASAATTSFGSSLNHEPANAGSSCDQSNLDNHVFCTHIGSFYPGTSGRAQAGVNGTITKIRVRAEGPMTLKFKVVKVRVVSTDHRSGQAKVVAVSRSLRFHGPDADSARQRHLADRVGQRPHQGPERRRDRDRHEQQPG